VRVRVLALGDLEDFVGRDVEKLGLGVDEVLDQPRAGDSVRLRAFTGDPAHVVSFVVGRGVWRKRVGIVRSRASAPAPASTHTVAAAGQSAYGLAARSRPPSPGPTMKPSCQEKPLKAR